MLSDGAYIVVSHQLCEFSYRGVRADPIDAPLCIASLTFMADLRCSSLRALGKCSFGSSALGLIIQGKTRDDPDDPPSTHCPSCR